MGSIAALALVTPLFGLGLTPPDAALDPAALIAFEVEDRVGPSPVASSLAAPGGLGAPAFLGTFAGLEDDGAAAGGGASVSVGAKASLGTEGESDADGAESGEEELSPEEYSAQVRERADLGELHRVLGISTYAAMGLTLVLGGIQYHNLYGFGAGRGDNPCVTGDAIFGQGQCSGTPWLHLSSSLLTAGLYTATFTLSVLMPDPDDADEGDSEYAEALSMHKLLRWVHFGGMVAQMLMGFMVANSSAIGLDRANDYGTLQGIATAHLGIGVVTFGAMTWAMLLML